MSRKYKPVELALDALPAGMGRESAVCPNCENREAGPIGRLGRRLVFRCEMCRVRFHRASSASVPRPSG
ncbi:MAG: hypothetical protein NVSMB29_13140 [Candidatus Dormibacteria bacterium]